MTKNYILIVVIIFLIFSCAKNEETINDLEVKNNDDSLKIEEVENQVKTDAVLVDDRVRLRDDPDLDSETILFLENGERVKVLDRSKKIEQIGTMEAYWYNIKRKTGEEGWMYGEFLSIDKDSSFFEVIASEVNESYREINQNSLDRLSNLIFYNIDNIVNIDVQESPEIESEIDSKVYNELAGIYSLNERKIPSVYDGVYLTEFSWGKDYDFIGRGIYIIDYKDGKWLTGGDGEAQYFNVESASDGLIVLDFGMKMSQRYSECEVTDDKLVINNRIYYKYSSPKQPMKYLKQIISERKKDIDRFEVMESVDAEKVIGELPYSMYYAIKNKEITTLYKNLSSIVDLPNFSESIFKDELSDEGDEIDIYINEFSKLLNNEYCTDFNNAVALYNRFILCDLSEMQEKYPNSIVVELFNDFDAYIVFVFINENGIWKLRAIINNALEFA